MQRMDMGECSRVHDLALRADYEAAQTKKDHFYDVDACDYLTQFVNDIDKKIEQSKKHLAETQEALSGEVTDKANNVHELAEDIGKKLAAAEQLGAEVNTYFLGKYFFWKFNFYGNIFFGPIIF